MATLPDIEGPHPKQSRDSPNARSVLETTDVEEPSAAGNRVIETHTSNLARELEALRLKVADLERKSSLAIRERSPDDEFPDFNLDSNSEDEAAYDPLYERWKLHRQVARQIIQKVDNLRRRKQRGRPVRPPVRGGSRSRVDDNDAASSSSSFKSRSSFESEEPWDHMPILTPTLKMVRWSDFKAKNSQAVIEVLIGSPEVVWHRFSSGTVRSETKQPITGHGPPTSIEVGHPGESPLPERIRINSPLLLGILANVQNAHNIYGHVEHVVFLRPFKYLIYYQHELRAWYERLLRKHEKASDSAPEAPRTPSLATDKESQLSPGSERKEGNDNSEKLQATSEPSPSADHHIKHLEDVTALQHLGPLMQFLDDYVLARQAFIQSALCKRVTFQELWLLFKPGDEIIHSEGNQAYQILRTSTQEHAAIPPWARFAAQPVRTGPPPQSSHHPQPPQPPQPPPPPQAPRPMQPPTHTRFPPPPDPRTYAGDDKPFRVECVYIDTDGHTMGPVREFFEIQAFEGEKSITDLLVYPLRYRESPVFLPKGAQDDASLRKTVRQQLEQRGRFFLELNSIRHMYYTGPVHKSRDFLDEQVVVDNSEAFVMDRDKTYPNFTPYLSTSLPPPPPPDPQSRVCSADCCAGDNVWGDSYIGIRRNVDYQQSLLPLTREEIPSLVVMPRSFTDTKKSSEAATLNTSEYVIMSDRVFGFGLRSRKWAELNLAYISAMQYQFGDLPTPEVPEQSKPTKTAFDDLVLPPGHKNLILSLVAQHFRDEGHHEVDIFRGKGKGLILLLHGAPGVGKTSTAEGIAEAFKKPLLQITCGDLGSTAKDVEEALGKHFALASRWDCVLLLDEADVFLASRAKAISGADLNRNALVAVFLRVLEYYTGILFLTTNRIGDFDEAFASRIHVSLKYPALDRDSTKKILALNTRLITERFKKSNRPLEIDEIGIGAAVLGYWEKYDKARLNGRQIRNACQTALALAEFEAQGGSHETVRDPNATIHLESTHFDTVLKAYLEFNRYLKAVHGTFQDDHAGEMGWRAPEEGPRVARANPSQAVHNASMHPSEFPGRHLYQQAPQASVSAQASQAAGLQYPAYRDRPAHEYEYQSSPRLVPPTQHLGSSPPSYAATSSAGTERIGRDPGRHTSASHDDPYSTQPYNPGAPIQRHEPYQADSRY